MSLDQTLCFDGEGTVVASKNETTGTIIHVNTLGEIRQAIDFHGTQAHYNPDYPGLLFKARRKKKFKGYGLKKLSTIINMQLKGEL